MFWFFLILVSGNSLSNTFGHKNVGCYIYTRRPSFGCISWQYFPHKCVIQLCISQQVTQYLYNVQSVSFYKVVIVQVYLITGDSAALSLRTTFLLSTILPLFEAFLQPIFGDLLKRCQRSSRSPISGSSTDSSFAAKSNIMDLCVCCCWCTLSCCLIPR